MKNGTRYDLPDGGQILVTKGGDGVLRDGDVIVLPKGAVYTQVPIRANPKDLKLGKRWGILEFETLPQSDGTTKEVARVIREVLVIKPCTADLSYDGMEMAEIVPKVLPSAD